MASVPAYGNRFTLLYAINNITDGGYNVTSIYIYAVFSFSLPFLNFVVVSSLNQIRRNDNYVFNT